MKLFDGDQSKKTGVDLNGSEDWQPKMSLSTKQKSISSDLSTKDKEKMAIGLSMLLADAYTLYLKTQNFHWNVRGPQFLPLHQLFMIQYTDLALAIDLIAERIRAIGASAPGTFSEFSDLRSVTEEKGTLSSEDMLSALCEGNMAVIKTIRHIFPVAEKMTDYSTMDLLTTRLQVHEKNHWMLSSCLNGNLNS